MIHVVMKNGIVVRYNQCRSYQSIGDWTTLRVNAESEGVIATIANDQIARLEFDRPCRIIDAHGRNVKVRY